MEEYAPYCYGCVKFIVCQIKGDIKIFHDAIQSLANNSEYGIAKDFCEQFMAPCPPIIPDPCENIICK